MPTDAEVNQVRTTLLEMEYALRNQLAKVRRAYALVDEWYWSSQPYAGGPMTDNPPVIPERLSLLERPAMPEPEPPAG